MFFLTLSLKVFTQTILQFFKSNFLKKKKKNSLTQNLQFNKFPRCNWKFSISLKIFTFSFERLIVFQLKYPHFESAIEFQILFDPQTRSICWGGAWGALGALTPLLFSYSIAVHSSLLLYVECFYIFLVLTLNTVNMLWD